MAVWVFEESQAAFSFYLFRVLNERICHEMPIASSAISNCAHHHCATTAKMQ
jgi:hypothetical protein